MICFTMFEESTQAGVREGLLLTSAFMDGLFDHFRGDA